MDVVLRTEEVTPAHWPHVERLFGANGACGGCWCMHWRLERGEAWDAVKGEVAKARLRSLIESGKATGVLAFRGDEPVGWAAFGPKVSFARLARSPSLRSDDAEDVWAVPCFFIRRDARGQGVASVLLAAVVEAVRARGGRILEGYPVRADGPKAIPAAFAWVGTVPMFEKQGFEKAGEKETGKRRYRRTFP